ncbi:aldose epimerase family protein [Loktanella sp. Alg231-35]|uniref:aldose epimerase family protein n=1 Tax=Loktanella sp. Alg231-35 TaxID=1922220 RepID=UPI000D5595F3|nr:aldose epimerase family protein [Loktanella sp. Alg231-35]
MAYFGTTQNGKDVEKITIAAGDLTVSVLTFGAIVQEVRLSDVPHGLALGSDKLQDYETTMGYFGAIVGPIANRISNARVRLDGMMYELERNENGAVHLHSGSEGVHRSVWQVAVQTADSVTLALNLPDGAAGLPGQRDIRVTYQVSAPATLTMSIDGNTDAATCMNFASHIYWNLDGAENWDGHKLQIAADHYLPVDARTCPTGEIAPVASTAMDFRQGSAPHICAPDLDHNFCLSDGRQTLRDVLWLTGRSGLCMTVATTEAGMQIHDAATSQRPGKPCYEGLVIEPQAWPDAPNHRGFGSIAVTEDQPYAQVTRWRFTR